MSWRDRAECRDRSDIEWFHENRTSGGRENLRRAREVCAVCPVAAECLSDALEDGYYQFGIRAGLTASARLPMVRVERVAECGTEAGYRQHRRAGEEACRPCLNANAAAKASRLKATTWANYGPCVKCGAGAGVPCRTLPSACFPLGGTESVKPHPGRSRAAA